VGEPQRPHLWDFCGTAQAPTADALAHYRDLLPGQERVLGPDHPDTLTTRASIAVLTLQCGDAATVLRLCQDPLDLGQVFGRDRPNTVATRQVINLLAEEADPAAGP
jgi:hypothetical protein